MTTEQRIARLDKRIALFEQYLNLQYETLCILCPTTRGFKKTIESSFKIVSIMMNVKIIASQPISKHKTFSSGGIVPQKTPANS